MLCSKVLVDVSGDSFPGNTFTLNENTGSLFHRLSGRTISFQYVEVLQNGKVLVCADQIYGSLASSPTLALPENLFSPSMITVSVVCQSLSVVSLFLVLCTYCLFPELRTLPGKNTLALVLTLLLAMLTFQLGVARVEFPTACVVLGVLIHYLLLSSFTWMLVCSFHMYRIFTRLLHHAHIHIHRADQDRWTLARYAMVATAGPALVVCLTLLANYLANRRDSCSMDLGYGVGICYLSNRWSLLLASVLPISLMMLVNLVLFLCTVVALRPISLTRKRSVRHQHRQLLVFIRMSSLTGINWLAGLAAASIDSPIMWHAFNVLCGLQGLYVFAAFICNRRVFLLYRHLLCATGDGSNSSSTTTTTNTTGDAATSVISDSKLATTTTTTTNSAARAQGHGVEVTTGHV
ncbi:latrophilin receptor-like protein A [Babylonia areolata]|uniref:latrophilin receptor-like protein A n=1 Tax=Babylonia areolata TaxID=304850 RepID=UPI003FD16429